MIATVARSDLEYVDPLGPGGKYLRIHIHSGSAPPEVISAVIGALDDLHRAYGVISVEYSDASTEAPANADAMEK